MVRALEYDMSGFMEQCVEVYCENVSADTKVLGAQEVSAPFIEGGNKYVGDARGIALYGERYDAAGASLLCVRRAEKGKQGIPTAGNRVRAAGG